MKNLFIIHSFQKKMAFLGLLCYLFLVPPSVVRGQTRSIAKPTTTSDKRLALVIGNSTYAGKPLPNARNDAQDVATMLRSLGFEVILKENLSKDDMVTVISDFTRRLRGHAVGLFYFAGHGFMSTQKDNYLMGTGVKEDMTEAFAKSNSIALEDVMGSMEEAQNTATKILMIDACRNNPFRSWGRGDQKGLGSVTAPDGLIAFFAASPNEEASENPGKRNGLFTQELLAQLKTPNLGFDDLIRNTTNAVKRQNPSQRPYRVGDLSDVFYFNLQNKIPPPPSDPNAETNKKIPPSGRSDGSGQGGLDLPPFMELVRVAGGTFKREGYDVTVSSFQMGKYEVTVGQFAQFVAETNYKTDAEKGDGSYITKNGSWTKKAGINWRHDETGGIRPSGQYNHPVVHVSHNDAVAFCGWLSKKEGKVYRLPTEAEWEYAAGGGSQNRTAWAGTDSESNVSEYGNIDSKKDSYAYTSPVGIFKANGLGLHDMSGNVWEWCVDWYGDYLKQALTNPTGPATGTYRVLRGGSWNYTPNHARVAYRFTNTPDNRNDNYGFRLVSQSQ